ncbi:MAG: outer membrane protein assembly factor BamE [Moraxellaceae bacterium]|nr:outer membrane protein assembly factor BamE [Moraxellaceae bacterium]
MQKSSLLFLLCAVLAGCGNFLSVYKADIDQGNVVTQEMASRLKPGMTPAQVKYVLGTPLITDTLNPKRWDYLYDYTPGTYARKAGVPAVNNRRLTVFFENGVLARIEGAEAMPARDPVKPESRDRTLTAEPL